MTLKASLTSIARSIELNRQAIEEQNEILARNERSARNYEGQHLEAIKDQTSAIKALMAAYYAMTGDANRTDSIEEAMGTFKDTRREEMDDEQR